MRVEALHDGDFASAVVLVDGQRLDAGPSQRVWNHSPDGFAWGYGGGGPAQLPAQRRRPSATALAYALAMTSCAPPPDASPAAAT